MPHTHRASADSRLPRAFATVLVVALLALAVFLAASRARAQEGPPDFSMVAYQGEEILGGSEVRLSDLLGRGEPVVLNFWAPLCPPCRQEMPSFQRVHDELGSEVLLVSVDVGAFLGLGSHDQARAFLREHGITYPTAYATSIDPVRDYEVRGMPTTLFLSSDGTVVAKHTGYLPEDGLRRQVRSLLAGEE